MRFSVEEYGYSKKDVNNALELLDNQMKEQKNRIFSLKHENEKLQKQLEELQSSKHSDLSNAYEKLKKAEDDSEQILASKANQIEALLGKWRKIIQNLYEKYPFIKNIASFRESIEDFESDIKATLTDARKKTRLTSPIKTSNDSMRALLEKLGKTSTKATEPTKVIRLERLNVEEEFSERPVQIKPITQLELNKDDKFETLMEKFLEAESESISTLEKHLISVPNRPNEFGDTGFDLKEAVNPKDDLEEIMKAFDFFEN